MKCKIQFNNDTRRVNLEPCSFDRLDTVIREMFLFQGRTFSIKYQDDEGELISVSSDGELDEAFAVSKALNQGVLKLHVSLPSDKSLNMPPSLSREMSFSSVSSLSSVSSVAEEEKPVAALVAVATPVVVAVPQHNIIDGTSVSALNEASQSTNVASLTFPSSPLACEASASAPSTSVDTSVEPKVELFTDVLFTIFS